ncbi:MAG: DUF3572 family protein [Hyphomicrobium sp.]
MMRKAVSRPTVDEAEALALHALAFLAEQPARLDRFLGVTGVNPGALRSAADRQETLAAVLDHLCQDESLLLEFCANKGVGPDSIAPAHLLLAGADGHGD